MTGDTDACNVRDYRQIFLNASVACCRALAMWFTDKAAWAALSTRIMEQDWSWDTPALDYIDLYFRALKA